MFNTAPCSALAVDEKSNRLYCGLGGHLHVYDVKTQCELNSQFVLKDGSSIGGFDFRGDRALVFGGKRLVVVNTKSWKVIREMSFKDKIMVAKFDRVDESTSFILGFAHNFVRFRGSERWCFAKCLLYSMAFYLNKSDDLIVASGTVFGDIIIWNPKTMRDTITLRGHAGSIFGVKFSEDGTRLCSISDDRTLRLWNLETKTCIWTRFGHKARIWDVTFLGKDRIATVSEDSTCRVWRRKDGECVSTWTGHCGYHAWSVASDEMGTFVVSGGSDGAVRSWDISGDVRTLSWTLRSDDEVETKKKKKKKKKKNHDINVVTCVRPNHVLALTNRGVLMIQDNLELDLTNEDDKVVSFVSMSVLCDDTFRTSHPPKPDRKDDKSLSFLLAIGDSDCRVSLHRVHIDTKWSAILKHVFLSRFKPQRSVSYNIQLHRVSLGETFLAHSDRENKIHLWTLRGGDEEPTRCLELRMRNETETTVYVFFT